jgi:uncharacterized protein
MPPLTLDDNQAAYQIRAYKPGFIKVNEVTYTQSLIVSPTQIITDWNPQAMSELSKEDLQKIIPLQPTLLLIGTGETLSFPPVELYGELINQGIGVEIMDTSAACRTYNVLTAENRNVVAALIIK